MNVRYGRIVLEEGIVVGRVRFGSHIESVEPAAGAGASDGASLSSEADDLPWIVPGFIDVHVHGGGGGDVMDGPDGVRRMARTHLEHGTTTLLPTTLTASWDRLMQALEGVAQVRDAHDPELPDLPGVHLEGPFLAPDRLGAQPDAAQLPEPGKLDRIVDGRLVRVVTMAPEIDGALAAAARLAEAGIRVSAGHTRADAASADRFFDTIERHGGVASATHLFNAMGGIEARAPGLAGVALARPEVYAELICDGVHVAAATLLVALRAKGDRAVVVTDAIAAAGSDATTSTLGDRPVRIADGAVRLADGTLAGSILTMDRAVRTLVDVGLDLPRAVAATSSAPARYLGLDDRGVIRPGRRADLVVLTPGLDVAEVLRAGRTVVGRQA